MTRGRGHWAAAVAAVVAMASGVTAATAADEPVAVPLRGVRVEPVTRERMTVVLVTGSMRAGIPAALARQDLQLGAATIPVQDLPQVQAGNYESEVRLDVDLRTVPADILAVDLAAAPLRWRGMTADGAVAVTVGGAIGSLDRQRLQVPVRELYDLYVSVGPVDAVQLDGQAGVRALVSLYNPLGFDVVAKRLDYRLLVGGTEVVAGRRPGVRLRAGKASDVLVEERLPVAELAAGVMGLLSGKPPVSLTGTLVLETPRGERFVPLGAPPGR